LTGQYGRTSNAAFQGISDAQQTGGYDPGLLAEMRKNTSSLAASGGVADEATNAYKDFATTGGFSDVDKSRYLRQATSGVTSTGKVLQQQAARQNAASHGTGGPAAIAQMARQLTQTQADSTDKALADMHAEIDKNKMSGAGGLVDVGRLKEGGAALQQQLESGVAGNKMQANQLMQLASSQAGQQILSLMGIDMSSQQGVMDAYTKMSQNPGLFGNIMKIVGTAGAAAGGVGGLLTGIAAI